MASLKELIAQRSALEEQIAQLQSTARADAIAQVRTLMEDHGLSIADLGERRAAKADNMKKPSSVAAKYRNQSTGETWSGRGLKPRWLNAAIDGGAKIDDFKI